MTIWELLYRDVGLALEGLVFAACMVGFQTESALAPLATALLLPSPAGSSAARPGVLGRALHDQLLDLESEEVSRWEAETNTWALLIIGASSVSMACFVIALLVLPFVR